MEVILVDTRHAGNIGSTARVMKNFGFVRLTLVNPTPRAHMEAIKMGVGAEDIIENARIVNSLQVAIEPVVFTYAVSRRVRRLRKEVFNLTSIAQKIVEPGEPVGLVFGSEKFGLSNDDLRICDNIVSIPTSDRHPSLNLAQSVAIVLFELTREDFDISRPRGRYERKPVTMGEKDLLFENMVDTLQLARFFDRPNPERTITHLKDILNRAGLSEKDTRILLGMFKQIKRKILEENERGPS
ncbi:tRNA:Cm32/Um32 methyltransferase [hydrothermal vent metagenome]|uniref:tRNA:Cm32/Um32 methyltransferase n=1 Tax=hydrothermal vent metagenome TaxID=652676 RepID=A0A3B1CL56_9ZZZZ